MQNGTEQKSPIDKSETASDATNMFGVVLIRRFNNIARSVKLFPRNKSNKISTYKPNTKAALAWLLD